ARFGVWARSTRKPKKPRISTATVPMAARRGKPMRLIRLVRLSTLPLKFGPARPSEPPVDRWAKITHQMVNNVLTSGPKAGCAAIIAQLYRGRMRCDRGAWPADVDKCPESA